MKCAARNLLNGKARKEKNRISQYTRLAAPAIAVAICDTPTIQ